MIDLVRSNFAKVKAFLRDVQRWAVTMSMSLVTELARSGTEELARRPESSGF